MKISESEVILIVVLVLIGFVLYTSRTMKTTSVKTVGEKHSIPNWYPEDCIINGHVSGESECPCLNNNFCKRTCTFSSEQALKYQHLYDKNYNILVGACI